MAKTLSFNIDSPVRRLGRRQRHGPWRADLSTLDTGCEIRHLMAYLTTTVHLPTCTNQWSQWTPTPPNAAGETNMTAGRTTDVHR
jgi:hypothetical protein